MFENKINKEELKKIQIGILDKVAEFCDSHDVRYFLSSGTLIGAVRHKGYIPWDDDIDLYMVRHDYDRFINEFNSFDKNFRVLSIDNVVNYTYAAAKVEDCRTILIEHFSYPIDIGVNIDIFPVDGVPDDIQERKKYFRKIAVARKKAFLKTLPFDFTQRGVFKNIILCFCKLWLCTKTANQLMKEVEERIDKNNDSSLFVCNLVMGNGFGSEFRREVIEDTCEVEFEGKMYKTMAGYDEYLRKTYGDYMKLPPESKRNTFHVWEAYYK